MIAPNVLDAGIYFEDETVKREYVEMTANKCDQCTAAPFASFDALETHVRKTHRRFFDRDELYRHYRKDHYFCHFCDSDGHEEYYKEWSELRLHFLKHHYLCELDGCSANSVHTHEYVVFRTELDFQVSFNSNVRLLFWPC